MPAPPASVAWFRDARFGIFVHWGLYSVHGKDVWTMYDEQTPVAEYRRLADAFAPAKFDADEWAALAKEAGARYMVLCTRQHDGYSLWDSAASDFTSVTEAARRDFVAEYAAAARRAGLGVGFYYSLLDWRYPAYFRGPQRDPEGWAELVDYVHAQVRELCTQYGRVDVLWYDGDWPWQAQDWRSRELEAMVRELQPGILVNDRTGLEGDFDTPEQQIPHAPPERPWEACMTINDHWGYCPGDQQWKSPAQLIANIVRCASGNGNFLLNVGPDPDGVIPAASVERLRAVGRWLAANGASVYGTEDTAPLRQQILPADHRMGPYDISHVGMVQTYPTMRGTTLYVHALKWPGSELTIGNLASTVTAARFLDGGTPIDFRQDGTRVHLTGMPQYAPDPCDTVIALECDGVPTTVDRFAQAGAGEDRG
ncbi:MAG TPA: alpha-L-fucosidase [Conexibacter sp.]|nr:alpha-L-fucosidase [Conexibacter sp.]